MTHRMFRLAVLVSLSSFLTADATAQTQSSSNPFQDPSGQPGGRLPDQPGSGAIVVTDPQEQAIGLAEDTEIMGQILDDALEGLYQGQWEVEIWDMASGQPKRPSPGKIRAPHAVYLDRYGVVYQLEAPPLHQVPKKVKVEVRPAPKPLTVWEKTRRRLRGEKVQEADQTEYLLQAAMVYSLSLARTSPTKDQLVRKLLDVLAKNGHNFRHLAPEERLTVAITFRKSSPSDGGKRETSHFRNLGNGMFDHVTMNATQGEAGVGRGVAVGDFDLDGTLDIYLAGAADDKAHAHETTGDLHMRQGNDKKAIEAYEKALRKSFPNLGNYYIRMNFPQGGVKPEKRRLMQKLSQAQIGAGNFDKARQVLDNLSRAEAASSKAHEKSSLPFSAQLVVSVKKADLDAVAAGKIKGEEFKKRATLRSIDPGELRREGWKNPKRDVQRR